jgi:membrane protease subunit (stomatin/prohibitin family)
MAATATNLLPVPYRIVGNLKKTVYSVLMDNSYEEGGEAVTKAQLGLSNGIESTECLVTNGTEIEATPVDSATYAEEKVKLINSKTSKELAKEVDASKVKVQITAYGW